MKNKLIALAVGGSLLMTSSLLWAEGSSTGKPAGGPPHGRPPQRGENLLPKPLIEKLSLSDDQKKKIDAIEDSWDKARKDYMDAHKAEADAAKAAAEEARKSDDPEKKKLAAEKRQELRSGLKPVREQYMDQVKSVLSDEQKKILEEAKKKHGGPGGPHGAKADKAKTKPADAAK